MLRLRVKEIAEAQGLNRSQLQLKSGVTLSLLNRYWNNNTSEIRLEALEKIAKALGVKSTDLLVDEPTEEVA
jgi:transcriptional regulator with XRE-family HTH domain